MNACFAPVPFHFVVYWADEVISLFTFNFSKTFFSFLNACFAVVPFHFVVCRADEVVSLFTEKSHSRSLLIST